MIHNRKSAYVKFAKAYCDKLGKFEIDATGKRMYNEDDFIEAYIIKHLYETRNRKGK